MEHTGTIRIKFSDGSILIIDLCRTFIMVGMATDLKIPDFSWESKFTRRIITGFIFQLVTLRLITIFRIRVRAPLPGTALRQSLTLVPAVDSLELSCPMVNLQYCIFLDDDTLRESRMQGCA